MRGLLKLRSMKVVGVLLGLAVGGGAAAALAGASSTTITWSLANSSAPHFSRMACPSTTLCVGIGESTVAVSSDPTGGSAGDWSTGSLPKSGTLAPGQIACAGTAVCVTTQSAYIDYSTTPAVATSWSSVKVLGSTGGPKPAGAKAACTPSGAVLCVVDFGNGNWGNGTLYVSTNSTATAWKALAPPSGWDTGTYEDTGLSCPTSTFCAMIGDDPTLDGGEGQGAVWTTNPTAATPTWTETAIDNALTGGSEPLASIWCPSSLFCLVGDANNSVLTSSNPASASAVWDSPVDLDPSTNLPTSSADCPTARMCVVAIDQGSGTYSSTSPTGPASAWSPDTASGNLGTFYAFQSLSCPSASLCIASDGGGNILVGTPSTGTTTTSTSTTTTTSTSTATSTSTTTTTEPPVTTTSTTTTTTTGTQPPLAKPSGTKITKSTIKKTDATFAFKATDAAGFQCGLVGPLKKGKPVPKLKFRSCKSPKAYKHLKKGSYSFAVRGVNSAGDDPHQASKGFKIK
jgi:hypothetical protein